MSGKIKWPAEDAIAVAQELINQLEPICERICIAGSIRRGRTEVGDIELLYIPRMEVRSDGLFDTKLVSLADELIENFLADDYLVKRPSKTGVFTWGRENKLSIHKPSGIPVDLFGTDAARWWVALVIRTGSKPTNIRLTTGANALNRTLNAYGTGVTDRKTGEIIPATSERHVFALCGVPYLDPSQR